MTEAEVMRMALDALTKVMKLEANTKGAATERLEAMAKVVANLPWDEVATLSIAWETVKRVEGGRQYGNEVVEFLPTLDIKMKEQSAGG